MTFLTFCGQWIDGLANKRCSPFQDAKTQADAAKNFAADYLASKLSLLTDPFQIAITGWALHVAQHNEKNNAYALLKSIQKESKYWITRNDKWALLAWNSSVIFKTKQMPFQSDSDALAI